MQHCQPYLCKKKGSEESVKTLNHQIIICIDCSTIGNYHIQAK